jgi:hypothetical protein
LPGPVFVESWTQFFFFDPDRVFHQSFVTLAQAALRVEGGECACVAGLDDDVSPRFFAIGSDTSPDSYLPTLASSPNPWLLHFGRFACSPDVDTWCIYCWRGEEMGILALRSQVSVNRHSDFIGSLYARRFDEVFPEPVPGRSGLVPEWRTQLRRNYN